MSPHSTHNGGILQEIRQLPLAYDHTQSQASAQKLILSLFPEWQDTEGPVNFIAFKDGITNTLLKAVKSRPGCSEEENDQDAVLIRAYGSGTEILIDRERELTSHSLLAQHGLAPALLARFENGLIYDFIRGHVCTPHDLTQRSIWRGVACKIAEWHALLPIETCGTTAIVEDSKRVSLNSRSRMSKAGKDDVPKIAPGIPTPNIWSVMDKWILAMPATTASERSKQELVQQELKRTASELMNTRGLGGNGLIFAHCDLLSGNVIVEPRKTAVDTRYGDTIAVQDDHREEINFIDYEYATPAPSAFDLANHFSEWGGFDCDYNALPTRSIRRAFITEYITSYNSHIELDENVDYVDSLMQEVDAFRGVPGLYWGIWALVQATISQLDFDYASYAEVRLGEYWAWRAEQDGSRLETGREMPFRERRWAEE